MLVSELIDHLKTLPQDRSVVCQVVGQNSGAWMMEYEINNIAQSDWMCQLRVSHPDLMDLPMDEGLFARRSE